MVNTEELNEKFKDIYASRFKRAVATFFDFLFVLIINVPAYIFIIAKVEGKAWTAFLTYTAPTKTTTVICLSAYIFLIFFIFFSLIPSFLKQQTVFSFLFEIKSVPLDGKKLGVFNFFKSYLVVVYLAILLNLVFYSFATIQGGDINAINLNINSKGDYWKIPIKVLLIGFIFIQIHYFITVFVTKHQINWFNKFSNAICIDLVKAKLFEKNTKEILVGTPKPKKIKVKKELLLVEEKGGEEKELSLIDEKKVSELKKQETKKEKGKDEKELKEINKKESKEETKLKDEVIKEENKEEQIDSKKELKETKIEK